MKSFDEFSIVWQVKRRVGLAVLPGASWSLRQRSMTTVFTVQIVGKSGGLEVLFRCKGVEMRRFRSVPPLVRRFDRRSTWLIRRWPLVLTTLCEAASWRTCPEKEGSAGSKRRSSSGGSRNLGALLDRLTACPLWRPPRNFASQPRNHAAIFSDVISELLSI